MFAHDVSPRLAKQNSNESRRTHVIALLRRKECKVRENLATKQQKSAAHAARHGLGDGKHQALKERQKPTTQIRYG